VRPAWSGRRLTHVGHADPRQNVEAARQAFRFAVRAAELAHRAAEHAAVVAAHQEMLIQSLPSAAERHGRMAALHRRTEKCQRAAERMHLAFARNLELWLSRQADGTAERPRLLAAVASTSGWQGAVLTLYNRDGAERLVAASDATARHAHELEVTLAEGPSWDAARGGNVTTEQGTQLEHRWPRYGPAVGRIGVHAVSAAPVDLAVDQLRGTLTVVGDTVPTTSVGDFRLGDVADALARTVLRVPSLVHSDSRDLPSLEVFGDEDFQPALHQAAGVLHERCGWDIDNAIALIRAHAYAEDRPVQDVAEEVVSGGLLLP
jgi:hypothetical protein